MRLPGLSTALLRVLRLVLLGHRRGEIAFILGVCEATVNTSMFRLRRQLGVVRKTPGGGAGPDLILLAVREGWLVQGPGRTLVVTFPVDEEEAANAA
jgi:DNA-binding NarL/FixJ family response regulator